MSRETNASKVENIQLKLEEKHDLYEAKSHKLHSLINKENRKPTAKEDMLLTWYCKIADEATKYECEICEIRRSTKITNINAKRAIEMFDDILEMEKEVNILETDEYIDHMMSNLIDSMRYIKDNAKDVDKSELKAQIYLLEYITEIIIDLIKERFESVTQVRDSLDIELFIPSCKDTLQYIELIDKHDKALYEEGKLKSHLAKIGVINDMLKELEPKDWYKRIINTLKVVSLFGFVYNKKE